VTSVLQFAVRLFPGDGPTGTAEHHFLGPVIWHGLLLVIGLAAAFGWYHRRRWALPVGLAIEGIDVLVGVAVAVVAMSSGLPSWLRADAPTVYADAVAGAALGVLLVLGRRGTADTAGSTR
jgi:uncharacterized membrane protein AbrB (regulator of aidB expression)